MRRRLAVALIALGGIVPWLWFFPEPTATGTLAKVSAVVAIPRAEDWIGGFSGIEISPDGQRFYLITDRGHIARGHLDRQDGMLSDVTLEDYQALVDKSGVARGFPHTDAEGLAVDDAGRVFVSFEHVHRILRYDRWEDPARWPSYTRAWRALSQNAALEALAVDTAGTLFTIPEAIPPGAREALVYRRRTGEKWEQPFTVPVDEQFAPVGADFGPDGKLYLLERRVYPFGFISRVRRMVVHENSMEDIDIVLETPLGRHGNLEGLSVWQDDAGQIRLTMVSDDNFLFFMRCEIVEYVLDARLAIDAE